MTKLVVGSRPFDMTSWDLSDIANGTVTASGTSEVDVDGAGSRFVYKILGDFTAFDVNGFPTAGTVTGFSESIPGRAPLSISDFSLSASSFMSYVNGNDAAGLETTLFAGNDELTGRSGNDVLLGYGGNDEFNLTLGGNDNAQGGDGNDVFNFGAAFTAADSVDGGAGSDKVVLDGDYSAGVTFGNTTMVNVETIQLDAGFDYSLTLSGASNEQTQSLVINAGKLGASNVLNLNYGSSQGALHVLAGAGNDIITGGTAHVANAGSVFNMSEGGNDTIVGGGGIDTFNFGGTFTTADSVDGGDVTSGQGGADTLNLDGDYSAPLSLGTSINHINNLNIKSASVDLTLGSNTVPMSYTFFFVNIRATDVTVDLSVASGSQPVVELFYPATGTVTGGDGVDRVIVQADSPNITVNGNGGDDLLQIDGTGHVVASGVHIDGGAGNNELILEGGVITLAPGNLTNIQTLLVFNHTITTDADVAAGQTLNVMVESGTFDGSAETDGSFNIQTAGNAFGGAGDDTFTGLNFFDRPAGRVTGGLGGDTLDNIRVAIYNSVAESTGVNYDTIENFNLSSSSHQSFRGIDKPTAFDPAIAHAAISTATFDADLAAAVGATQMAAGDAVVVHVTSGTLSGQTFLVVDHNGVAGYQADADWVLDLGTGTNPSAISTDIFT